MKQVKTYNFIDITKKEFQQYQATPITNAQAVEIQNNLFGVVDLLLQWSSKENIITESTLAAESNNIKPYLKALQ